MTLRSVPSIELPTSVVTVGHRGGGTPGVLRNFDEETGMRVPGFADTVAGRRELVSYLDRRILEEGQEKRGGYAGGGGGSANE